MSATEFGLLALRARMFPEHEQYTL